MIIPNAENAEWMIGKKILRLKIIFGDWKP